MDCPRCGRPMRNGVCENCGFPITAKKMHFNTTKHAQKSVESKKHEY